MGIRQHAEMSMGMDMGLDDDSQLVKNANFADETSGVLDEWTSGTGWAYGTNGNNTVASKTAGVASDLVQDISAEKGRAYMVVIKTLGRTSGTITIDIGGQNGTPISTNDRIVQNIVCGSTDSNLRIEADAAFDGDINSILAYVGV